MDLKLTLKSLKKIRDEKLYACKSIGAYKTFDEYLNNLDVGRMIGIKSIKALIDKA